MALVLENLADLILDLHEQYGSAFPKPSGMVVKFQVIHENTTYQEAKSALKALLTMHGLTPLDLVITPGPEVKKKWNRSLKFSVPTDLVT